MAHPSRVSDALLTLSEAVRSTPPSERVPSVLDVARGAAPRTDLRRALVDVVGADVAGLTPPGFLPLPAPPPSPLLAMAAALGAITGTGAGGRFTYTAPHVTSVPTANVDAPEKSDAPATGTLTIADRALPGHLVDIRVDLSVAVEQRTAAPDAIAQELAAVVVRRAEVVIAADLAAQATGAATTLADAVALAASFGTPVVILAGADSWGSAAALLAPMATASPGSVMLVPIASPASGATVFPKADLALYVGDLFRLRRSDPTLLGSDYALALEVVAAFGHDGYASHVPAS